MNPTPPYHAMLNERRRELGMSYAVLAERSNVSIPTIVRILSGKDPHASLAKVMAIAEALGMAVCFKPIIDVDALKEQQAAQKAKRIVAMVQGTSGLEAKRSAQTSWSVWKGKRFTNCFPGPNGTCGVTDAPLENSTWRDAD